MRQQTRELALASVLGALAVLFLFLGGVLPLALYACPLLASACLLPVREECRASYHGADYDIVSCLKTDKCLEYSC